MVKASTVRLILTASGLLIMVLILLSNSTTSVKFVGVFLSIFLIAIGIIITGPLRKYFEETKEGTLPPDSTINYK